MPRFRHSLARFFTAGFWGTQASADILDLVEAGLGGVILFQRNVESPAQLLRLVRALKQASPHGRLVVSIDQEGGRVARLRGAPWTQVFPMRALDDLPGAEGVRRAEALGRLLGRELRCAGIDLDFAPVLDVDTNPTNPVIGDRAFSGDPDRVARLGAAFALALQAAGVAACGKHFPGHGDTTMDSHLALPRIMHALERLESVELVPFRAVAKAGVASIMTAHVVCEAFDAVRPATLSPPALRFLRQSIGYDGVVFGDDLEMKAVSERWTIEDAAVLALGAGCDHLLVCSDTQRVGSAVVAVENALASGALGETRLAEAARRWDTLARRYARPAPDDAALAWLGSEEQREMARRALGEVVV